jgi:repressor of nif and glnA expression
MPDVKGFTEELKVEGKELVETVKRIIHEGNVRRVVVRNPEGRTILDIPVNAGVLGAVVFPMIATLATIAVYAARYTLIIERNGPPAGTADYSSDRSPT